MQAVSALLLQFILYSIVTLEEGVRYDVLE